MTTLEQAEALRRQEEAACVVCLAEKTLLSRETGIRPLVGWLAEDPEQLKGGAAADKIVGKAAALLLVYGGVTAVHAGVLSDGAARVLEQYGIPFTYDRRTPYIINRTNTGMCPMEQRVQSIDDPAAAFEALRAAVGL